MKGLLYGAEPRNLIINRLQELGNKELSGGVEYKVRSQNSYGIAVD